MTKKLEDLFDLPEIPPNAEHNVSDSENSSIENPMKQMQEIVEKNNTISKNQFDSKMDIELDDIAEKANNTYNELISLGANVDSRYSARIFEVASIYLKISLDAKNSKINKVLKSSELELKQEKLKSNDNNRTVVGNDHIVSDRNSLLEKLRNLN